MPLIRGVDSAGVDRGVLVDASGRPIVVRRPVNDGATLEANILGPLAAFTDSAAAGAVNDERWAQLTAPAGEIWVCQLTSLESRNGGYNANVMYGPSGTYLEATAFNLGNYQAYVVRFEYWVFPGGTVSGRGYATGAGAYLHLGIVGYRMSTYGLL